MSDIQALQVSIGADVAQFMAAMQQSTAAVNELTKAQTQAAASQKEHASAVGFAVEAYHLAGEGARFAAQEIYKFGEAAIEAANVMDPSGALQWNRAVDNLKDSFTRFAGAIGRELRPAIEDTMAHVAEVFAKLSRMDWADVGKHILNVLKDAFAGVKSWASDVLEVLTYPFRAMVGYVEDALGRVMEVIGKAAAQLGGTAIGKRLGLNEFSGDAFAQTGADMVKQGEKIAGSLSGAMEEVGKGLGAGIDAALARIGANPDVKAIVDAYKGASSKAVANVDNAGDIALIESAKLRAEEMGKLYDRVMGKTAANSLASSMRDLELTRQKADLERSAADYAYQQALKDNDNATASYAKAQAAAEKIHAAYAASVVAVGDEVKATQKSLEQQQAAEAASAKAVQDFKAQADVALELNQNKLISAELRARNDADIQHYQILLQQLNQDRMFRQQTEQMLGQKRMEYDKLSGEQQLDYAKRLLELLQKRAAMMTSPFDRAAGGVGGITGNVEGAASGAFQRTLVATGGNVAAAGADGAVAALQSLVQNSAGFKKFQDAINGVLQKLADAVGSFLEPIAPAIDAIGSALGPALQTVSAVLKPIGEIVAQGLEAAAPVLKMLANTFAAILAPIGRLLQVLGPLIKPIIGIAAIIIELEMAFDPLMIAFQVLSPFIIKLANLIQRVVGGIASVWDGIVNAIAGVFYKLSQVEVLGAHPLSFLSDWGDAIEGASIDVNGFDAAIVDASGSVNQMSQAAMDFVRQATDARSRVSADTQKSEADYAAYLDLKAKGQDAAAQAAYDAFVKDSQQRQADLMAEQIAEAQAAVANGQGAVEYYSRGHDTGETNQQHLNDLLRAQAEMTAANSAATNANTKTMADLQSALANAPSGFRKEMYEYAASASTGGASNSLAAAAGKIAGETVGVKVNGPVTIQVVASDPNAAGQAVLKALRNVNARQAGLPVSNLGGKFS